MRHIFYICIIAVAGLVATACGRSANKRDDTNLKIKDNIESMLVRYPFITLQDIYKGYFQDCFGPAHLISDTARVKMYILSELDAMSDNVTNDISPMAVDNTGQTTPSEEDNSHYYEPCGWMGNYYRVDIAMIRDGIISLDAYTDAFVRSTIDTLPNIGNRWIETWNRTATNIKAIAQRLEHNCLLEHYERDSTMIDSLLHEGHYVVHHSEIFNKHHHPHYRIIRNDIFEREILPLITANYKVTQQQ